MHVHDVGAATFQKVAIDLGARITDAKEKPLLWAAIGGSGNRVVQELLQILTKGTPPLWLTDVNVIRVAWDPAQGAHALEDPADAARITGASVLMVDSIVNTGATLQGAYELLCGHSPAEVATFAIAVRHTSAFIPNVFSLTIDRSDRVFLPWHEHRANNRMTMVGSFRTLGIGDLSRPSINSTQEFINRVQWRDRWYSTQSEDHRRVLVCERQGGIAAFINFVIDTDTGFLHVEEVATDRAHEGLGLAGALLRYAETCARWEGCTKLALWAHDKVVLFYERKGFAKSGRQIPCGNDVDFHSMERSLGSSKAELRHLVQ